jgi:hypothetical protein
MIWRTHPIYSNYEASEMGDVRNCKTGRILKSHTHKVSRYPTIVIPKGSHPSGCNRTIAVHRIVVECFLGMSLGKHINHINHTRGDNRIVNLEYCTPAENISHCIRAGRANRPYGENHSSNKFSREQIFMAKDMLLKGIKTRHIVKETGVSRDIVYRLKIGKVWNKDINSNSFGFIDRK